MISPLISYCQQYQQLSPKFIELIKNSASIFEVDKNTDLESFLAGNLGAFFLINGLIRKYSTFENKEITLGFVFEKDIFGSNIIKECYFEQNRIGLQTLEKTTMVFVPYVLLEKFKMQCKESIVLFDKITRRKLSELNHQSAISRIPNATSRYKMFCKSVPGPDRIQGKFLASYLAIREETLSRIRHHLSIA